MQNTVSISLRVPHELHSLMIAAAERNERSLAAEMRLAARCHLERLTPPMPVRAGSRG